VRKVCIFIGSRANYSSIKSVMRAVREHPDLTLQLIVGASALLDRFGSVVDVIEADGFKPDARVTMIVEGSGRLRATHVEADNLQIGLAGSGQIELSGTAEAVIADIQGTGDVDASQLRVENATITTGTTGEVAFHVVRAATVNAFGLGNVTVAGAADCTVRGLSADLVRCAENPLNQR